MLLLPRQRCYLGVGRCALLRVWCLDLCLVVPPMCLPPLPLWLPWLCLPRRILGLCLSPLLSLSLFLFAAASSGPCPMLPPPGIVWSGREKRARFLMTSRLCFPCFARLFVQRTRFALHCRHCPQSSCPMHFVIRWKKLSPLCLSFLLSPGLGARRASPPYPSTLAPPTVVERLIESAISTEATT